MWALIHQLLLLVPLVRTLVLDATDTPHGEGVSRAVDTEDIGDSEELIWASRSSLPKAK